MGLQNTIKALSDPSRREILELLNKYNVRRCFYGHLHGPSHGLALEGLWDGIDYRLVASDRLDFKPFPVCL